MAQFDRLVRLMDDVKRGEMHKVGHLAARFGVTPRTIARDIRRLRELGIGIHYDKQRSHWRVDRESTISPSATLTVSDVFSLLAVTRMSQLLPAFDREVQSAATKLLALLSPRDREAIDRLLGICGTTSHPRWSTEELQRAKMLLENASLTREFRVVWLQAGRKRTATMELTTVRMGSDDLVLRCRRQNATITLRLRQIIKIQPLEPPS